VRYFHCPRAGRGADVHPVHASEFAEGGALLARRTVSSGLHGGGGLLVASLIRLRELLPSQDAQSGVLHHLLQLVFRNQRHWVPLFGVVGQ
jgi:hypothetical protein